MSLTLKSTIRLSSGHQIPILGFGVFQNYDARTSVLQAFDAGYRHVDCAQAYRNEEAVGKAVSESRLDREDIFYSGLSYALMRIWTRFDDGCLQRRKSLALTMGMRKL